MAVDYQEPAFKFSRTIIGTGVILAALAVLMFIFDHAAVGYARSFPVEDLKLLLRIVTELGHGITILIIFLVLVAFYEEYQTGFAGIISQASVGIVTGILKPLVARARPFGGGGSFPSGHTAAAFAAAVVLAHRFPRFKYVLYLLAAGVGVTRFLLHKHFPSDVLAGAAIGLVVGEVSMVASTKLEVLYKQRWVRPTALFFLLILLVYSLFGSDVPRYLVLNVGSILVFILARRTAIIQESSGNQ
jgi:undecaprenyl-diphosphatase